MDVSVLVASLSPCLGVLLTGVNAAAEERSVAVGGNVSGGVIMTSDSSAVQK